MLINPTSPDIIIADDLKWWEDTFLEALPKVFTNVSKACELCKYPDDPTKHINRSTVYDHYNNSERFKERWDQAMASATDRLRETAFKVGLGEFEVEGVDGKKSKLPPSTPVLLRLLEAHDPNYRAVTRSEITGKDGKQIEVHSTNTLDGLDQATADRLIEDYVKRKAEQPNKP